MCAPRFLLGALHPISPSPPGNEPTSGDRYVTQLGGQLHALFALSPEKDTPRSFRIDIGVWRRAVSSPRARSIPVGPVAWSLRLAGSVMNCMLRSSMVTAPSRERYELHVEVLVWASRKCRVWCFVERVL